MSELGADWRVAAVEILLVYPFAFACFVLLCPSTNALPVFKAKMSRTGRLLM